MARSCLASLWLCLVVRTKSVKGSGEYRPLDSKDRSSDSPFLDGYFAEDVLSKRGFKFSTYVLQVRI